MQRRRLLTALPLALAWPGMRRPAAAAPPPRAAAAAAAPPLAATPLSRADLPWWSRRHAEKRAESLARHPTLVWLGDSITQNFERTAPPPALDYAAVWQHFYGDRNAINLGFNGDTTAHVLWRVLNGELDGAEPKLVILLVGANNLGLVHWSAADTLAGIEAILAALHQRAPHAAVLLLSVLPRGGDAWVVDTRRAINRGLAERYGHPAGGVVFRDLTPLFERDGRVNDTLYADPQQVPPRAALHPTPQGMALIAAAIEPTVAAILGDRNHTAA
jgi:lysophospholipase L1-like esterase